MGVLLNTLPFLAWGPLTWIATQIVTKIISIALYETEMAAFLAYTDLRVARQGRDFVEAALANANIQKTGTPEEKARAEAELIEKLREFVKLKN